MAKPAVLELRPALQCRQGVGAQPVDGHLHGLLVGIALGGAGKPARLHGVAALGVGVDLELLHDDHGGLLSCGEGEGRG